MRQRRLHRWRVRGGGSAARAGVRAAVARAARAVRRIPEKTAFRRHRSVRAAVRVRHLRHRQRRQPAAAAAAASGTTTTPALNWRTGNGFRPSRRSVVQIRLQCTGACEQMGGDPDVDVIRPPVYAVLCGRGRQHARISLGRHRTGHRDPERCFLRAPPRHVRPVVHGQYVRRGRLLDGLPSADTPSRPT